MKASVVFAVFDGDCSILTSFLCCCRGCPHPAWFCSLWLRLSFMLHEQPCMGSCAAMSMRCALCVLMVCLWQRSAKLQGMPPSALLSLLPPL